MFYFFAGDMQRCRWFVQVRSNFSDHVQKSSNIKTIGIHEIFTHAQPWSVWFVAEKFRTLDASCRVAIASGIRSVFRIGLPGVQSRILFLIRMGNRK